MSAGEMGPRELGTEGPRDQGVGRDLGPSAPSSPSPSSSVPTSSSSTREHRAAAAGTTAQAAVLTVSDSRTPETDRGGLAIQDALTEAGHAVAGYTIVKDEPTEIDTQLRAWLHDKAGPLDVILTTGGTGISSRDTTIEIVDRLLDKRLDGFGELFRMLSWDEVGPASMLSRAVAGLAGETLIFAMPGSTNAVKLAMASLIIPELPHLIWERRR